MLGTLEAGVPAAAGPPGPPLSSPTHSRENMHSGRIGFRRFTGLVVNWKQRPFRTSALFAAANTVLWFLAFGSHRAFSLLAVLLLIFFITVALRDAVCSRSKGANLWRSMTTR
ncbi:reticulophagy regulator 1-like [Gouania willdenowi]|uniref:reticulophagy regulator 1-like n=1 Tax=Gouania willdenowi TaxID=441366 RepID=UPI0010553EBC|nr:reticulophagy regulator 1-like [Gouania willdenowi]